MLRGLMVGLMLVAGMASAEDLLQLHRLAVESDPDYRAIRHGHDATLEQKEQATGAMLPSIDLNVNSMGNKYFSTAPGVDPVATPDVATRFNDKRVELTITQPVYRPDLFRARTQAEWRNLQSKAELDFALQDLIVRLSERYFGVLRAADELDNAKGELEAFGRQLELSKDRLEFGLVTNTDVDEAQAGYDMARARVIETENELRSAHDALAAITGQNHPLLSSLRGDSPLERPDPVSIEAWTAFAAEQNLSLQSFRYAGNVAEEEVRRASAGHLPNLDLVMRRARDTANGGQSGPLNADSMQIGLQLTVPIFRGAQISSRTREARALHQQAQARFERERRAILRETRESYYAVQTSIARIEALRQAVKSAESAIESIAVSYELNLRTSFEVLLAQRELYRARRDLSVARYDYVLGILRLKRAAGTLAEADVARVNAWLEARPAGGVRPAAGLAIPQRAAEAIAERPPGREAAPVLPVGAGESIALRSALSLDTAPRAPRPPSAALIHSLPRTAP